MKKYEREQEFINLYKQTSHFNRRVYDNWNDLDSFGEHSIVLMNVLKKYIEWAWQNIKSGYSDGELFNKYTDNGADYDPSIIDNLFILEYIEDHDFQASAEDTDFAEDNLKELYNYIYEIDTIKAEKVCLKLLEKDNEAFARKFLLNKIGYDSYRKMFGYYNIQDYYRQDFLLNLKAFIEDRTTGDHRDYYSLY